MPVCPFSGSPPVQGPITGYENLQYVFDAPQVGGRYCTKQGFRELEEKFNELSEAEKDKLAAMMIDLRQSGQELPELTFDLIAKAKGS